MKTVDLKKIERFLDITGWGPSRFGRAAVGDSRFVAELRKGREMRRGADVAVAKFMTDYAAAEAEKVTKLKRLVK